MSSTGGIRMSKLLASGKVWPIRGGLTLDLYNQSVMPKICCTITTRLDSSNHYWLMKMKEIQTPTDKTFVYTAKNGKKYDIAIRKYTPRDAFRLMGVHDADIDKLCAKDEKGNQIISNSRLYKLAGNSIVTNCMTAMFEELFYPSGKHYVDADGQLSLF